MAQMHDADLCKRIKELEDRVRELEARPSYYCGCNHWHYTPYYHYPYVINTSESTGNISIGTTVYDSYGVQSTYTSNSLS